MIRTVFRWLVVAAAICAVAATAWWIDTHRTPTGRPQPAPQTTATPGGAR